VGDNKGGGVTNKRRPTNPNDRKKNWIYHENYTRRQRNSNEGA